ATLSSSCSDNSGRFTSFTSCFASFSIFSIFLLSSLMVFLLFEMFSYVNSRGRRRSVPNQLPSPYKVQTNEKRGQNSFPGEQSIHPAHPIRYPSSTPVIAYVFGQVGSTTCSRADQVTGV